MNYLNKIVNHSIYGSGRVIDENDKSLCVDFEGKIRFFPLPDAITNGYLMVADKIDTKEQNLKGKNSVENTKADLDFLRNYFWKEYENYLINVYNPSVDKPLKDINQAIRDTFFLERYSPEMDFMHWFESEDTLKEAYEFLVKHPMIINRKTGTPESHAKGYMNRMFIFRDFLKSQGDK